MSINIRVIESEVRIDSISGSLAVGFSMIKRKKDDFVSIKVTYFHEKLDEIEIYIPWGDAWKVKFAKVDTKVVIHNQNLSSISKKKGIKSLKQGNKLYFDIFFQDTKTHHRVNISASDFYKALEVFADQEKEEGMEL